MLEVDFLIENALKVLPKMTMDFVQKYRKLDELQAIPVEEAPGLVTDEQKEKAF